MSRLPSPLQEMREEIEGHAKAFGLEFFETIFEMVDYDQISEIAAYGGFPTRYPHWRFGMEYDQLSKSSEYGLSKIYEMVINTDPAYAYLLDGNRLVDQRTVIAHVFGHVDFFANNYFFSKTNRKMVDQMANHATRVRRLIDKLGVEKVERLIDVCLSLDNLIDYNAPFIERPGAVDADLPETDREVSAHKLRADRGYMYEFINPPEVLAQERAARLKEIEERKSRFPVHPQRDVLLFLMQYAPLEGWELEILNIIREEAYYFAPQGMTKIMNEGWASYWHSRILCEKVLQPSEIIDYAEAMSGVLATSPGRLNPYKLGIELWRDIEHRWDRGMFGPEWEDCNDLQSREQWDKQLGEGQAKLFRSRKLYNDVTFVDEFLTQDFVERQKLYTFGYNPKKRRWEIDGRQFAKVKQQLLDSLTNFGQPFIEVKDANFRNRGELLLSHRFLGTTLQLDYAKEVLTNLQRLWKRPVFIETIVDDRARLIGFDGSAHSDETWDLSPPDPAQ